ncbi:hypothetical protein FB561_5933 [Kribbella amoyensis]|uniref:Uncharacterized protein n=1 Tax=Kribbella amoyensis TaxID=996641 RepID=A0A561C0M2_9ACTN|nr:hypothetical protein [Kribbella amoyensis]TWD84739.1 hypothetical protein FB561_5933 [Kribbella amoyensis]
MKKQFAAVVAVASSLVFTATTISTASAAPVTPTWQTANSVATGDQDAPSVATNRNGYVAVVWEDDRDTTNAADNAHSEIYLRLFRNGTAVYEKKLSAGGSTGVTNWRHLHPDVGLDDKGNAVVVWADDPDGNGYYNVPYRVVNTSGTVTASGNANNSSTGQQITPRVAVDPDGAPAGGAVAFTVVWEDIQTGAQPVIKAAGFTGPTTRAWQVTASQATGQHHNPDVAVSASGDAVVVWDEDGDANAFYNVGLIRLGRMNGAATLSRRIANENGGGQQTHATVAANFTGDFAVAWESDHTGTAGAWTRTFDAAGAARFGDVEVGAGGKNPGVGLDDQANTVVGWTVQATDPATDLDVWVRGFGPDGTDAGRLSAQQLSQATAGRQEELAVAVSPWSEVAVAYTDDNDGNTFDQVILGSGFANNSW